VDTVLAFQVIATDTVLVFPTPAPAVVSPVGPLSLCDGLVQTLSIGATTNQISWYLNDSTLLIGQNATSADVTTTGNYTAVVTSADGCSAESAPVEVNFLPNPPVPVVSQNGGMLQTSAIGILQWFFNGTVIPGATLQTLMYGDSGTYSVQITGANGCTSIGVLYVATPSGMDDGSMMQIQVFPNPVDEELTILGLNPGLYEVFVFDIGGRLVYQDRQNSSSGMVSLRFSEPVQSGIYTVRCRDAEGKQLISRFIKK
jgi:hypothetical protein